MKGGLTGKEEGEKGGNRGTGEEAEEVRGKRRDTGHRTQRRGRVSAALEMRIKQV